MLLLYLCWDARVSTRQSNWIFYSYAIIIVSLLQEYCNITYCKLEWYWSTHQSDCKFTARLLLDYSKTIAILHKEKWNNREVQICLTAFLRQDYCWITPKLLQFYTRKYEIILKYTSVQLHFYAKIIAELLQDYCSITQGKME